MAAEEEYLTCPFNEHHSIKLARFSNHLVKCAKSHPTIKLVRCPYDAKHMLKSQEDLLIHLSTCLAKAKVEAMKFIAPVAMAKPKITDNRERTEELGDEEDWANEIVEESYNPMKAIEDRPVIRNVQVVSRSQRDKFRAEEKKRHQMLIDLEAQNRVTAPIPGMHYRRDEDDEAEWETSSRK